MEKVLTEVKDRIYIITINRPEVRNAIDGKTAKLLEKAWKHFRDSDDLYVAIITGAGDQSFCAGADLKNIESLIPDMKPTNLRKFLTNGTGYLGYTRQTDIFKPIIAAVNGYALAGGLEIACLADIRIAEEHAEFGVACRRFGVPLVDGGTQRLARIIGMGWAMELIITGKFIGAEEAYRIGLANEIVAKGRSLERAIEIAKEVCSFPQGAIRTDKEAVIRGFGRSLDDGLKIEAEVGFTSIINPDMREGVASFAEKRNAKFKNE